MADRSTEARDDVPKDQPRTPDGRERDGQGSAGDDWDRGSPARAHEAAGDEEAAKERIEVAAADVADDLADFA